MAGQLTWLVTGCSSGLGEALVHSILAAGDKVIATARSRDKDALERLTPLKDAGAGLMELDVTSPAEVLDAKAKEAWSIYGHIDVLVNNAANIDAGIFEEIDEQFLIKSLRNNALGPLNLTRAFLPYMRARHSGTILFMSSVAAYYGAAGASAYSASKGLLEALVPSLAVEIEPFGLRTCLLTPGYFRTRVMTAGNILYNAPSPLPEYVEMNKLIRAFCDSSNGNQPGDPHKAATVIVDAVRGKGHGTRKELPARLPLGSDGLEAVMGDCQAKLRICEEWGSVACATTMD